MKHREVTLDDKYDLVEGKAYMTGIQALVRLPLDRRRIDQAAGFAGRHEFGRALQGHDVDFIVLDVLFQRGNELRPFGVVDRDAVPVKPADHIVDDHHPG